MLGSVAITSSKYTKLLASVSYLNSRFIRSSNPHANYGKSDSHLINKRHLLFSHSGSSFKLLQPFLIQGLNQPEVRSYATDVNKETDNSQINSKDPLRKPTLEKLLTVEEKMKLHVRLFHKSFAKRKKSLLGSKKGVIIEVQIFSVIQVCCKKYLNLEMSNLID